jgi:chemotaxis protein histidine kinase CheA
MTQHEPPCPEIEHVDTETRQAFLFGLREQMNQIERDMNLLDRDPRNLDLINRIFRSMHIIKGNCRMCMLNSLVGYIDAVEDLLDDIRSQRMRYSKTLGETILLSVDVVKAVSEAHNDHIAITREDFLRVQQKLEELHECAPHEVEGLASSAIELITTWLVPAEAPVQPTASTAADSPAPTRNNVTPLPAADPRTDLSFFRSLAEHVDQLTMFWNGRTAMLLEMALDINSQLDVPTNRTELEAAVYLHDIGMAFLPDSIINKAERLTTLELKALQAHPMIAAELASRFPNWESTADIILQHHERYDGSGYPNHLKGDDICTGAAILSIVDAFYSVTNSRADRIHKRSALRAITEINMCAGTQFDPYCVDAFNRVMRQKWVTPTMKSA